MKKLLYAINHRQTEDMISEYLSGEYLPVGAATYKEAIIEQLHSTGADVVLIRDSLPGSTSLESAPVTFRTNSIWSCKENSFRNGCFRNGWDTFCPYWRTDYQ